MARPNSFKELDQQAIPYLRSEKVSQLLGNEQTRGG